VTTDLSSTSITHQRIAVENGFFSPMPQPPCGAPSVPAEINQRLRDPFPTQEITYPVSNIAFGNRPQIDLHPRQRQKTLSCGLVQ
jgi:hypothetical protein